MCRRENILATKTQRQLSLKASLFFHSCIRGINNRNCCWSGDTTTADKNPCTFLSYVFNTSSSIPVFVAFIHAFASINHSCIRGIKNHICCWPGDATTADKNPCPSIFLHSCICGIHSRIRVNQSFVHSWHKKSYLLLVRRRNNGRQKSMPILIIRVQYFFFYSCIRGIHSRIRVNQSFVHSWHKKSFLLLARRRNNGRQKSVPIHFLAFLHLWHSFTHSRQSIIRAFVA